MPNVEACRPDGGWWCNEGCGTVLGEDGGVTINPLTGEALCAC
jgi:hypothetical protein